MALPPGTCIGSYEVVAALGAGGMGEVYRARDAKLRRDVALKVLPTGFARDRDRLARFEREAHVLASLNHPNIGTIYGIEDADGIVALVLELVDGESLSRRIERGPVALEEAVRLASQIADALEAAHERGIVHRDLKPANIVVTSSGAAKVLDFGLAKLMDSPAGAATASGSSSEVTATLATAAGLVVGTPAYMSPEQARGGTVDRRSDIWAFGVVLYEMLTGRRLFAGNTPLDVAAGVLGPAPLLDELPPPQRAVVAKCLRQDPRARWQWIGDVRLALEESVAGTPTAPQPRAWRRALWPAMALLLAATLGVVAWQSSTGAPPEEPAAPTLFTVPIPGDEPTGAAFDVSPDGRVIAITASESGQRHLWIRRFDSLEMRRIPGTEGASDPFWSPDGKQVGFVVNDRIMRVAVTGSAPAQVIVTAAGLNSATWSRTGHIVYAASGRLHQVGETGGTPELLPNVAADISVQSPRFLPDGRNLLFTANVTDAQRSGVWLRSMDSPAPRQLVAEFGEAAVVESTGRSWLIFHRGDRLFAQRFDVGLQQLTGDSRPISGAVARDRTRGTFGVASATLAYVAATDFQLARLDRDGAVLEHVGPPGPWGPGFRQSPDETRIAYSLRQPDQRLASQELWQLDVRSGVAERWTFSTTPDLRPVWSPDGATLVFSSNRGNGFDPYVTGQPGGERLLIDMTAAGGWPEDWSADGHLVLQVAAGDLWTIDIGASRAMPITQSTFREFQGRFSPDVKWVAYVSNESGRDEVYVRPLSGPGRARRLSDRGGREPQWRGDGRELFYVANDGMLTAVPVAPAGDSVEFGPAERLFPAAGGYQASRDGKRFLVSRPVAPPTITVNLDWQQGL